MRRRGLTAALFGLALVGLALPLGLVAELVVRAMPVLSWRFLLEPARELEPGGGVGPELVNTLVMVGGALATSVPLGLAAAILRVEYLRAGRWAEALETAATLLAALPSVVVGLGVFVFLVGGLHWPFSRLTGTVALFVLNVPWVAQTAMAALARVPDTLREASLALGATRFQTVVRVVLPWAWPALATGIGIGAARLLGESAALIFSAGVNAGGGGIWAPGATLAVHLWYVRTEGLMPDADHVAAATGVVLLALVSLGLALGYGLAAMLSRRAGMR
ncbi:MAG: ABC transporter permease subunit [Actinomycetia bacterium]|nr:ABC transporter permease subunit [Actinomycetes bacterium]